MDRKRIALIAYESRPLTTFSAILNTIILLVKNHYDVDVYLSKSMSADYSYTHTIINVLPQDRRLFIIEAFKLIWTKRKQYYSIIPYYFEGLIVADLINWFYRLPVVYYSMEITQLNFYSNWFASLKKSIINFPYKLIEILAFTHLKYFGKHFIRFSIIQDKERLKLLNKEHNFTNKYFIVPNSYLEKSNNPPSNYLHRKYHIPDTNHIILYTGGIERGFDEQLFRLASTLPNSYTLVCHGFSRDGYIKEFKLRFKTEIEAKKLIIDEKIYNDKEYSKLINSAYIGLVWYQKIPISVPNMYYLGMSSGKLMKFLSCSIPIIAPNYIYGYVNFLSTNGLGFTCPDVLSVKNLLPMIEEGYIKIRNSISNYYKENLEFEKCFKPVIHELNKYTKTQY